MRPNSGPEVLGQLLEGEIEKGVTLFKPQDAVVHLGAVVEWTL
jgi:hypothetical protein